MCFKRYPMPQKNKTYIVWEGRTPGIYNTWPECQAQVNGFPNSKYKSFSNITPEQAKRILSEGYESHIGYTKHFYNSCNYHNNKEEALTSLAPPIDYTAIAVDAACSKNPGPMEYQIVFLETKDVIYKSPVYPQGTNNIGEFLALVHAMAWMEKHQYYVPIYSDSVLALSWVKKGKCRTKLEPTKKNQELMQLVARAEQWLHSHDQDKFKLLKWQTEHWGEIPADYGRKK